MEKALKGCWVEIENIVLSKEQRAPQVPEDTKNKPLVMWTRGMLQAEEAFIGEEVTIRTLADREVTGILVDLRPRHAHDFGDPVRELIETGIELRREIGGQA